jgi:hypothetical protein
LYDVFDAAMQKNGSDHTYNKPTNSVEYCTAPISSYTPYWVIPDLYTIGDTRKSQNMAQLNTNGSAEKRNVA